MYRKREFCAEKAQWIKNDDIQFDVATLIRTENLQ